MKSMRRTRRDRQSRDFLCGCGKAYLSYPALHTHIKKHHDKDEYMMEHATYPIKVCTPRGRPKRQLKVEIDQELQELTLIETAILQIY